MRIPHQDIAVDQSRKEAIVSGRSIGATTLRFILPNKLANAGAWIRGDGICTTKHVSTIYYSFSS